MNQDQSVVRKASCSSLLATTRWDAPEARTRNYTHLTNPTAPTSMPDLTALTNSPCTCVQQFLTHLYSLIIFRALQTPTKLHSLFFFFF